MWTATQQRTRRPGFLPRILSVTTRPRGPAQDRRRASAALRLGLMLMGAGAPGYRVIRAMKRTARALGFSQLDAIVSVNTITVTFHRGAHFRTVVANQHNPAIDSSRIEAIEDLAHSLDHTVTVQQLTDSLDRIEQKVHSRWSPLTKTLAAALACAAFALLNNFAAGEACAVAIAAGIGQMVRVRLHLRHLNALGIIFTAAAVSCLSYYAIASAVSWWLQTDPSSFAAGYVAAVLYLIPGFPLYSSLLDLCRFDFTAGVSRLTYAVSIIVTATISVSMVSVFTGLNPLPAEAHGGSSHWWLVMTGASFVGICGFAILFNSSRRMALIAGLVGTVANLVRLVLVYHGLPLQFAAFFGGVVIGLVIALITRPAHLPRVTLTVPAAVIMVPGAAMYRSMYYLNTGEITEALPHLVTAVLVVIFIAAGLAGARMLTDKDWAYGRLINFDKPLSPGSPGSADRSRIEGDSSPGIGASQAAP